MNSTHDCTGAIPLPTAASAFQRLSILWLGLAVVAMATAAPNALFEHQATNASTKGLFAHLRQDDQWIVRDDVFIKYLERKGPLTIGYASAR